VWRRRRGREGVGVKQAAKSLPRHVNHKSYKVAPNTLRRIKYCKQEDLGKPFRFSSTGINTKCITHAAKRGTT